MKRFLIIFSLMLTASLAMAQHMQFLNNPLGCSLTTFKQRMIEKGYKFNGEVEPNIYEFEGRFGGDKVAVGAFVTPKSKIVYEVAVFYDDYYANNSPKSIESQNRKREFLEESFVKKYGDYTVKSENYTTWFFDNGEISIGVGTGFTEDGNPLVVWYSDEESKQKNQLEREEDY